RVEEIVVNEVLSVFKTFDEELTKAEEEEKRRLEEEKRRIEEEEKEEARRSTKGKQVVESEPHPLVLVLQEQLQAQKVEQEKIKEDIRNLSEG
ncbi:hypothetical protein A2U01_0078870, partial [Trifolium medium]|nr:hypothetical protein [Trifolium medium]